MAPAMVIEIFVFLLLFRLAAGPNHSSYSVTSIWKQRQSKDLQSENYEFFEISLMPHLDEKNRSCVSLLGMLGFLTEKMLILS